MKTAGVKDDGNGMAAVVKCSLSSICKENCAMRKLTEETIRFE